MDNASNPKLLKLLAVFQAQHVRFWGLVELKTLEKLADEN